MPDQEGGPDPIVPSPAIALHEHSHYSQNRLAPGLYGGSLSTALSGVNVRFAGSDTSPQS